MIPSNAGGHGGAPPPYSAMQSFDLEHSLEHWRLLKLSHLNSLSRSCIADRRAGQNVSSLIAESLRHDSSEA
jgi:hypothetical protein